MTDAQITRMALKQLCLDLLDAAAIEHPLGHQGKLAARYVLRSAGGEGVELMFEKGPTSGANLWVCHRNARAILTEGLTFQSAPANALYKSADEHGKTRYGRHSALRPMRQLGNADLICFSIQNEAEVEKILEELAAG